MVIAEADERDEQRLARADAALEEFRVGELDLAAVVSELDHLFAALELIPVAWKRTLVEQCAPLETELGRRPAQGQGPGASDPILGHALGDLQRALDQCRADQLRHRRSRQVVPRQDNGDFLLNVLAGAQVEWVNLHVQAELRFMKMRGNQRDYVAKLAISEPFQVFDGKQRHPVYFGPPNDGPPYGLDVLARLIQETATGGVAFAGGALEVQFENGWRIEVPFGERDDDWGHWYEAGEPFSTPGGGLG